MKILSGLLWGLVLGIMLSITVGVLARSSDPIFSLFFIGWGLGIWLAATAKTMRQTWRRLFLAAAYICFIAPALSVLSVFFLIADALEGVFVGSNTGNFFVGAGTIIVMTILGLIFGPLFLIAAKLTGGKKALPGKTEPEKAKEPE